MHEVAGKILPLPVSGFQTLPVSEPVLLTLAILSEILYMLLTVYEQFNLRIKPIFHY